jgi:cell division septal protein FtsQ
MYFLLVFSLVISICVILSRAVEIFLYLLPKENFSLSEKSLSSKRNETNQEIMASAIITSPAINMFFDKFIAHDD